MTHFVWDINTATISYAPMAVVTHLDPETLDGITSFIIDWGDGSKKQTVPAAHNVEVTHIYLNPGVYHAKARTSPPDVEHTAVITARGLGGVRPTSRGAVFARPA